MLAVSHNPSLLRFPQEAAIIGRLVVGFGELELLSCKVADQASATNEILLKALYTLHSTSARLSLARTIAASAFEGLGLSAPFNLTFDSVEECRKVRNLYAHCQWADYPEAGLFYADLEGAATNEAWLLIGSTSMLPSWSAKSQFLATQDGLFCFSKLKFLALSKDYHETTTFQSS